MIFVSDIDNCFRAPRSTFPPSSTRAVLYVLRRDLEKLYGSEKRRYIKAHKAPMLAVLGMMAGIDLLSKFYSGKESNTTRTDFKNFLKNCGKLSEYESEALYQYRCALAHNYGLFTINKKGIPYGFSLDDNLSNKKLIKKVGKDYYHINFWQMKRFFLNCIAELESRLRNPGYPNYADLLNKFKKVMTRIGYIKVT